MDAHRWAILLHLYQPANQQPDILERVIFECYRPLVRGLLANPRARITLNVNGVLTELLQRSRAADVIAGLRRLAGRGQVELTASAKYHPFLPKLPEREIVRQIELNDRANRLAFGRAWKPIGFFSPELAYHPKVARVVARLGYRYLIADEVAYPGPLESLDRRRTYTVRGLPNLSIHFKQRRPSNILAGALVRGVPTLLRELGEPSAEPMYLLTAMDGETFGHHRPGLEEMLFQAFASPRFSFLKLAELAEHFPATASVAPRPSTWSSDPELIDRGIPYQLWDHPDNRIHRLQWRLTGLAISACAAGAARRKLDAALHSDQYWWASKWWWSLEAIEQGAFDLRGAIEASGNQKAAARAEQLYRQIIELAFTWQRDGTIRRFHLQREGWQSQPFRRRTPPQWYNQVVVELEDEMEKAARRHEYEQAIKWRDALYKLRSGADVYDWLHVVNELQAARSLPGLKPWRQMKRISRFARQFME